MSKKQAVELKEDSMKELKNVLSTISKLEQEAEVLRQFLCTNFNFEPYGSF